MKQTIQTRCVFPIITLLSIFLLSLTSPLQAGKKKAVITKSVNGCWQICQVKGQNIAAQDNLCFINFDCLSKKMNGFAACNYIHGKFAFKARKKTLEFAPIASTRMSCPEIQTENAILDCLRETRQFAILNSDTSMHPVLNLMDANGKILLGLVKMMPLDGKWKVTKVNDSLVDENKEVSLFFNSAKKNVHGKLGCNNYSAPLDFDPQKPFQLHIGQGIRTLMMCPDMAIEDALIQALQEVVSFKKFSDRKAILSNAKGKVLIELNR